MASTKLVWITGNAQHLIADIARVSNPANQGSDEIARLISYMIKKKHWSPFEMANACFEINTTRDIARQILRHRSFSFQEFSQRYADPSELGYEIRELRYQSLTNRQSSVRPVGSADPELKAKTEDDEKFFHMAQQLHMERSLNLYREATNRGIAKEQARAFLPEGMTNSRLYMNGTIRSWIHFCNIRMDRNATQSEHADIAEEISEHLEKQLPIIWGAIAKWGLD
jgi:thymidylate synthase (FAD)